MSGLQIWSRRFVEEVALLSPAGIRTPDLQALSSCTSNEENNNSVALQPFNAGIKSLPATLPEEIFYWDFAS
jgi:hypothetical protein